MQRLTLATALAAALAAPVAASDMTVLHSAIGCERPADVFDVYIAPRNGGNVVAAYAKHMDMCVIMHVGDRALIEDGDFSSLVCVGPANKYNCYWTLQSMFEEQR